MTLTAVTQSKSVNGIFMFVCHGMHGTLYSTVATWLTTGMQERGREYCSYSEQKQ